jgi:enamine deaminase RidA (YjgF/YER057c/UK114 family)
MATRFFNPQSITPPLNAYSHGAEVPAGSKLLFMAGQAGFNLEGNVAPDFESQIRQTYSNIAEVLKGADMDLSNLIKVTTFLTDRTHLPTMREIRNEILGHHKPAHTLLIVSGLAYENFLIEVECVAAS